MDSFIHPFIHASIIQEEDELWVLHGPIDKLKECRKLLADMLDKTKDPGKEMMDDGDDDADSFTLSDIQAIMQDERKPPGNEN